MALGNRRGECDGMKKTFALSVALCVPAVFGALSVWIGQDASWDLKNYHYYNAYAFLTGRWAKDIAPAQIQTFLSPLLDVVFYVLLQHLGPRMYGFVVGTLQGLNFSLLFWLALTLLSIAHP